MTFSQFEDAAYFALLKPIGQSEKAIVATMKKALQDIRGILTGIFAKYAQKGELTNSEMAKYNRMISLEEQVLEVLNPALKSNMKIMNRLPAEVYNESFYRHAWVIDASQGIRLKWGTLNLESTRALLDNEIVKLSINMRYPFDAKIRIRQALNQGLPVGVSLPDMASNLKKSLETTAYNALRIVRTEGIAALNGGQEALYNKAGELGVEGGQVWDATLDQRTRLTHQQMDGEFKRADGLFDGPGDERARYPSDTNLSASERINCRCRLRYEVSGYSPILRRTREEGLIPYQNYVDYVDKYHPEWK